ncbi:reverse transcriptase domain-containing protein [Tanacetum coccineum]
MAVWCRMFQQTLDGPARGWFDRMPNGCIDNWTDLCERFVERFSLRRKCSKDPTEVSKIIRRANETLPDFKERWTEEMRYIQGVPKMISLNQKREHPEKGQGTKYKGNMPPRTGHGGRYQRADIYNTYGRRDHYQPYVPLRTHNRRYDNRRYDNRRQEVNQLSLDSLTKRPKEILATELQLELPPCPPMVRTPKKESLDKYCDYHEEKGHYTNDCYQLKRQLEVALESGKLSHLVKDVR